MQHRKIGATHRDLQSMVADCRFREDLYYRLSTFPIRLPALRERAGDIPLLAAALLARVAPQRQLSLSREALRRLSEHAFPGNVRELRNVLERAALLCDGAVSERAHVERALGSDSSPAPRKNLADQSQPQIPTSAARHASGRSLREIERDALLAQLRTHSGSRAELAAKLGISERSLYRKLRAIGQKK